LGPRLPAAEGADAARLPRVAVELATAGVAVASVRLGRPPRFFLTGSAVVVAAFASVFLTRGARCFFTGASGATAAASGAELGLLSSAIGVLSLFGSFVVVCRLAAVNIVSDTSAFEHAAESSPEVLFEISTRTRD
jgi:hypothetical protein